MPCVAFAAVAARFHSYGDRDAGRPAYSPGQPSRLEDLADDLDLSPDELRDRLRDLIARRKLERAGHPRGAGIQP